MNPELDAYIDERIAAALAARPALTVKDLPVAQLQSRLELDWEPTAKDLLAPVEAWQAIGTFTNGANFNVATDNAVGFMKDPVGFVHLRGAWAGPSGGTVFTLPLGYRPPRRSRFICYEEVAGAANWGRCTIESSGVVNANGISGAPSYFSFEGITFRAEA